LAGFSSIGSVFSLYHITSKQRLCGIYRDGLRNTTYEAETGMVGV
jgi:hypothetical protein